MGVDNLTARHQMDHNLTNHRPVDEAVTEKMEFLRLKAKMLGAAIINEVPEGRERSLALTNLEQTVMWAIAGIARNQEEMDSDE